MRTLIACRWQCAQLDRCAFMDSCSWRWPRLAWLSCINSCLDHCSRLLVPDPALLPKLVLLMHPEQFVHSVTGSHHFYAQDSPTASISTKREQHLYSGLQSPVWYEYRKCTSNVERNYISAPVSPMSTSLFFSNAALCGENLSMSHWIHSLEA